MLPDVSDPHRHQNIQRSGLVILTDQSRRAGVGEVEFDNVAFNLAQDVHQIARVEADFEAFAAILAGNFFGSRAIFGAGDRQGDFVMIKCHFDGASFFGGDCRNAVNALAECLGVDTQKLVIRGWDDAAVIGEGAVN